MCLNCKGLMTCSCQVCTGGTVQKASIVEILERSRREHQVKEIPWQPRATVSPRRIAEPALATVG